MRSAECGVSGWHGQANASELDRGRTAKEGSASVDTRLENAASESTILKHYASLDMIILVFIAVIKG